jgi:hypothetical protein
MDTPQPANSLLRHSARGESRTLTGLPPGDFESSAPSGHDNPLRHSAHKPKGLRPLSPFPSCAVSPRVSQSSGTIWARSGTLTRSPVRCRGARIVGRDTRGIGGSLRTSEALRRLASRGGCARVVPTYGAPHDGARGAARLASPAKALIPLLRCSLSTLVKPQQLRGFLLRRSSPLLYEHLSSGERGGR